ncbi:Coiled-coil domain-containing protein 85B, partial [Ophiophagus hannah]
MNRQLREHLHKICELKAINGRLQAENHELCNLCCFLDEDQLKAKHLARHWQLSGIMRPKLGLPCHCHLAIIYETLCSGFLKNQ